MTALTASSGPENATNAATPAASSCRAWRRTSSRAGSEQETQGDDLPKDAAEWDTLLCALEAYKATNGDLRVPTRFCVPEESAYPEKCWGLKLGQRVASIRATGRYVGDETRRRKLDDLGFEWRLRRQIGRASCRERV